MQEADTEGERKSALRSLNAELDRAYTLDDLPDAPCDPWPAPVTEVHRLWWEARIARQSEIDASIGARAEVEYLYDKPYEDRKKVRVAGPFTVESLSPHRLLAVNEHDELIRPSRGPRAGVRDSRRFRRDGPRTSGDDRRPAGAQGRPDHVLFRRPVAG